MIHYVYSDATRRIKRVKDDLLQNREPEKRMKRIQAALMGQNQAMTNRYWEALTYFLPNLVYQNPKLSVTSAVPGEARSDAIGLRYALETLMDQQKWSSVWRQMAADALAWRGVCMTTVDRIVTPRHMDGQEFLRWDGEKVKFDRAGGMTVPRLSYVSPDHYFSDCRAAMREEAQHEGHFWDDDIDRLQALAEEDESWDKDEIARLVETRANAQDDDRSVRVYQVYCPFYIDQEAVDAYDGDEDPEDRDLFTGTIYTMVESYNGESGMDIRKPILYRGPAGGLYSVMEFINGPGMKNMMAPFAAALPQVDNDATIGRAVVRSIRAFKRIAVATETVAQAIINADHDSIVSTKVAVEDLQRQLYELQVGGPSAELLKGYELSDMACDRIFAMSDSLRANAGADTTATAETLAKGASDVRIHAMADLAAEVMEKCCWVAAWQIEHAQDFAIQLPDEAVEEGIETLRRGGMEIPEGADMLNPLNRESVIYVGGNALDRTEDPTRRAFSGKTVKVVPMSARRTNEGLEQQRAMQSTELVFGVLNAMAAAPGFQGKKFLNDTGAAINRPGLGEYLPEKNEEGGQIQREGMGGEMPSPMAGRQSPRPQRA